MLINIDVKSEGKKAEFMLDFYGLFILYMGII